MMKHWIIIFFASTMSSFIYGQTADEKPIETVNRIFIDYRNYSESTDSKDDQQAMIKALQKLQVKHETKDLDLLLDVWMYYDPTDFPGRELIRLIFDMDREATRKAIDKRIKNRKEWENKETAPYAELFGLRQEFL